MTESPLPGATVPQWTLGDRMRKARLYAGLQQSELAIQIGINRATITSYEADRTQPSRAVLIAWALCTGVPVGWLKDGEEMPVPSRMGGISSPRTLTLLVSA